MPAVRGIRSHKPGITARRAGYVIYIYIVHASTIASGQSQRGIGCGGRAQFGLIAAGEAVQSAGIDWSPRLRERTGVVTGSALGGQGMEDEAFAELYLRGRSRVHPLMIPRIMANALASHISMQYGITGHAYTVSTACSSANHAIGQSFWMIRDGLIDAALAGGSEAPFSFGNLKAWEAMRVVSPDTCRPFDKNRAGLSLGEAAAIMVLEEMEAAKNRGAKIYAEVIGFGMNSDAYHITAPSEEGEGAVRCMELALKDAGIGKDQIGYINAHGTSTMADVIETKAIKHVFGERAYRIPVSSTKSMTGHLLGAAGGIEAVLSILALHHGILPPTVNLDNPDPACDLDYVPHRARPASINVVLSNSFGFGGVNACLLFKKPEA